MKALLTRTPQTRPIARLVVYWAGAVLLGVAAGWLSKNAGGSARSLLVVVVELALRAYRSAGAVLIGLIPMSVWLGSICISHLKGTATSGKSELDLGFIQRNAMLVGLAGTVCALIGSTGTLASEVANGSAAAVLKLIPVVGQALISTLLGLIVAIGADVMLHLRERSSLEEGAS